MFTQYSVAFATISFETTHFHHIPPKTPKTP